MIEKAFIKSWNECVHKVVLLWAKSASCVFQGIEEQHDGDTHMKRHMHEIVPKLDIC